MVSPTPFVVPEYRPASAFNPSSRTLHLSGSSAHGNMDGRPRPLEPDLNSAGLSLPAQSPGFIDHLGDLHPAAAIHRSSHSTENYVRPSARNPIIDWYISQEKPWDPIQGRNPPPRAGDLRGNRLNIRPSGPAFSAYRESNVSSECESTGPGILPSDSGYESRTRQSVTNGSIYGDCDRSGDTGSISSHLADFQLDRPNLPSESWKQQGFDQTTAVPANVDSSRLVCLYCNQSVKTKSELKKHKQKHEKPHHCDVPNCTRTIGFSTPNDLDRHKRSCHPELIPNGKYYRCTVQGCRNKDKKWPRADNFRSHLKRLHGFSPGDDALEAYVYREPPLSGDLASLGTSIGDGLIPMDITSHGSGLNPNNWQYLDSGISLQAIQHKITRDAGTTNYIGHHMDFQQNAVIAQQQLHALSPNGDTEQMQGTAMQMSPVELATENELAHLEESHEQPQDHQAPTETADTSSDDEFNGADFLNDDSVSEQDAAEDEGRDEIQNAEVDLSRVERPRQDVDRAVQSIQDGNETTSSEPEDIESPDNATVQEYYPPPHPISSSPTTSTKAGTQSMSNDAVVIAQPDYAAVEELSVHGLDIVNDKSKASDLIKALEDKGTLAELLEQLGYQKSRATNATTRTTPSVRSLASDSCQVTCNEPNCRKVFPRPCELKKHQKRHEKPYGCTFPKCSKRFGSKNDWKRHENSQHHQLELWKCDEPSKTDPKDVCGRACHRREQFKIHLLRDHEICDQGTIDSKLEKCRVGRNCETRFWCGFCKMIVEIQDGGRNAWTERFNHIDDHFSGRSYVKMDISEWKSMDPDTNDIDLNLAGPSSGPSLGVDNGLKRSADAEAQQPRSRNKRPRAIETLWFCCHCGNQSLTSTSMNCCMDDCNGHIKCNACRVERVPREPQVLLQELQE